MRSCSVCLSLILDLNSITHISSPEPQRTKLDFKFIGINKYSLTLMKRSWFSSTYLNRVSRTDIFQSKGRPGRFLEGRATCYSCLCTGLEWGKVADCSGSWTPTPPSWPAVPAVIRRIPGSDRRGRNESFGMQWEAQVDLPSFSEGKCTQNCATVADKEGRAWVEDNLMKTKSRYFSVMLTY